MWLLLGTVTFQSERNSCITSLIIKMAARVFDGNEWHEVPDNEGENHHPLDGKNAAAPLAPILNGDGKIFVSIPSYRGL